VDAYMHMGCLIVAVGAACACGGERATGDAEMEFVTIYKAKRGRSAMYAQLTRLRDGALLCVFRDSRIDTKGEFGRKGSPWTVPGSRIVCIRSRDGGRTWTDEPVFIYRDPDHSAYTSQGGLGYQAADDTIRVPFYCVTMTHEGTGTHVHWNLMAVSRDNGRTWSCSRLPVAPFASNPQYGGLHQVGEGRLWRVERCRGYGITAQEARTGKRSWLDVRSCVRILESRDEGKTWSVPSYVGYDPTRPEATKHFPRAFKEDEPGLIRLPSGKILLLARPHLYQAVSRDEGRTWEVGPSPLTRQGATSGLCPDLAWSKAGPPGGTLVVAYHDRWGEHEGKGGVYLCFSHDEGTTWSRPTRLDGGAYPCLYELEKGSGRFLCAYYRSSSELKGAFFSVPSAPRGGVTPGRR